MEIQWVCDYRERECEAECYEGLKFEWEEYL